MYKHEYGDALSLELDREARKIEVDNIKKIHVYDAVSRRDFKRSGKA